MIGPPLIYRSGSPTGINMIFCFTDFVACSRLSAKCSVPILNGFLNLTFCHSNLSQKLVHIRYDNAGFAHFVVAATKIFTKMHHFTQGVLLQ